MKKLELKGIIAAGFSPFDVDGKLKLEAIPPLVDHLVEQGIDGFYLTGSTGEGMSCSIEQRMAIVETYMQAVAKRVPVIICVSHASHETSTLLTKHAIEVGADAVSANLPTYYGINNLDHLVYGVQKMVDCQDELPFIYYHIPGKTGLNFKMYDFLEAIDGRLPQLKGIKYTAGNLDDYIRCEHAFGKELKMYFGVDELFLPALSLGADAFIGSTYNFMLPLYQRMVEHHKNNDPKGAVAQYHQVAEIINGFLKYDGLSAQKAIMKMVGHDFGPPKPPVRPLLEAQYKDLNKVLEQQGFFNHDTALKK